MWDKHVLPPQERAAAHRSRGVTAPQLLWLALPNHVVPLQLEGARRGRHVLLHGCRHAGEDGVADSVRDNPFDIKGTSSRAHRRRVLESGGVKSIFVGQRKTARETRERGFSYLALHAAQLEPETTTMSTPGTPQQVASADVRSAPSRIRIHDEGRDVAAQGGSSNRSNACLSHPFQDPVARGSAAGSCMPPQQLADTADPLRCFALAAEGVCILPSGLSGIS